MPATVATISYRLGGGDGVAIEARKWANALRELGFATRRIAGTIEDDGQPGDIVIPGIAIDADETVDPTAVEAAFDGADLVIVDNICSLPINVSAARAVAEAAARTAARVCFRHHDLPWQRRNLRHLENEFPPRHPGALHATINLRSRRELDARGYANTTTVHNYFDLDPAPGDREGTRARFGFTADELVLFQPARAIARKNVPGGLRFAHRLGGLLPDKPLRYWLSGPAEDGYGSTLERIVERSPFPIVTGRVAPADGYSACDLVVFPSTWEGFGNPVIEAIGWRRPCAAAPYPVLAELLATGVRALSTERPEQVAQFLSEPREAQEQYFETNVRRARLSFDVADLPKALDEAFASVGWFEW
jgi:glycosyltransferase involved in cell wall biosynthesis